MYVCVCMNTVLQATDKSRCHGSATGTHCVLCHSHRTPGPVLTFWAPLKEHTEASRRAACPSSARLGYVLAPWNCSGAHHVHGHGMPGHTMSMHILCRSCTRGLDMGYSAVELLRRPLCSWSWHVCARNVCAHNVRYVPGAGTWAMGTVPALTRSTSAYNHGSVAVHGGSCLLRPGLSPRLAVLHVVCLHVWLRFSMREFGAVTLSLS